MTRSRCTVENSELKVAVLAGRRTSKVPSESIGSVQARPSPRSTSMSTTSVTGESTSSVPALKVCKLNEVNSVDRSTHPPLLITSSIVPPSWTSASRIPTATPPPLNGASSS